jgi:hypothetical protein
MKRLFAAVVLTFIASVASASGGWVLWQRIDNQWAPMDGYATQTACIDQRDYMLKNYGSGTDLAKSSGVVAFFSCFPSDFDPRGK